MRCSQEPAGHTQQVCSAGPCPLCSRPLLLSCCVVLSGCSQATVSLSPAATPQTPGLSKVRDTWKKGLGNKCKDHSALGEPAVSRGTKSTLGRRGFCLLPAHQLSSKGKIYTNMCFPTASTWTRDHQQKWTQTKNKCPDKAGPHLRILGRGHNSQPLLPSEDRGLGEPTPAL